MSNMVLSSSSCVGVAGVGLLGSAVAQRLSDAGWEVGGFDPKGFRLKDVKEFTSFSDLLNYADLLVFCLPNSSITLQLVEDHLEVFSADQIILDATTGKPEEMEQIASRLASVQVRYLEANVAGSSTLMRRGEAAMFFGGDELLFKSLQSFTNCLTRKPFYLGSVGAASRFKLVHNMILGLHRMVLAEGLAFAVALGLDPLQALEVLKQTPAASEVMASKGDQMVKRQFEPPQARLSQHFKDVRLILEQAQVHGLNVPLSEMHAELLAKAETMGLGQLDNSAVAALYEKGAP